MVRTKMLGGAAAAMAVGMLMASTANAAFVEFDFTGLSFNKTQQEHTVSPTSNDPASSQYTYLSKSDASISQATHLLQNTTLPGSLGQFVYTMFVPDTNVSNGTWTTLNGAHIDFAASTAPMVMLGQNGLPNGELTITGGHFDIANLSCNPCNNNYTQDLPFNLGQNITQTFYNITGHLAFEFETNGHTYAGTWQVSADKNSDGTFARLLDPSNGNPANTAFQDLVFYFQATSTDFTLDGQAVTDCIDTGNPAQRNCPLFDRKGTDNLLSVNLVGWGDGEDNVVVTPEPASLAVIGLGLLGLAGLRRRRAA